jgi:hypothetical protein
MSPVVIVSSRAVVAYPVSFAGAPARVNGQFLLDRSRAGPGVAVEVLRTIRETGAPQFVPLMPLFQRLEALRMPLAKHEAKNFSWRRLIIRQAVGMCL